MIKVGSTEIGGLSGGLYKFSGRVGEMVLTSLFGNQIASKASLQDTRVMVGCSLTFGLMFSIVAMAFVHSDPLLSSAIGGLVSGLFVGLLVGGVLLYFIKRIERDEANVRAEKTGGPHEAEHDDPTA